MGLDGVEIVMKVEETFDIAIADSEAEKIVTPSELIDLIFSKAGRIQDASCLTQRAFHRLRASLIRHGGVQRSQIRLETSLATLFPRARRVTNFQAVATDLGLSKEMEFVRPSWLVSLLVTATVLGSVVTAISLTWHPISSSSALVNFIFASPAISAFGFAMIFGWAIFYSTRWMRIEFKSPCTDVGHLSRWIVAHGPHVVQSPPGQWSREQIAETIREIVIEILHCEEQYREDAHFIKDLGLS
ncbi:MAG TPA: hypothetical protein VH413_17020 [Verrucomicrobiae bacterium]|nr:hypothetical protein [Verrucomicrobiae bacterium]